METKKGEIQLTGIPFHNKYIHAENKSGVLLLNCWCIHEVSLYKSKRRGFKIPHKICSESVSFCICNELQIQKHKFQRLQYNSKHNMSHEMQVYIKSISSWLNITKKLWQTINKAQTNSIIILDRTDLYTRNVFL